MRRSLVLVVLASFAFVAGCSSAPPPPPILPDDPPRPPSETAVVVDDARPDPIPRSIRRLVSEERGAIDDIHALLPRVGDARGRARAADEADRLARELAEVEAAIDATNGDSARLDESVDALRRLATRIALLHDVLRTASL